MPTTLAARSNAWTVFSRSNTGIVGSNHTWSMDVYVRLFSVCVVMCVGSGFATGWSPVQGLLPAVYGLRNWKSGYRPQGLYNRKEINVVFLLWCCQYLEYLPPNGWSIDECLIEKDLEVAVVS
jgi:hypothetical protein